MPINFKQFINESLSHNWQYELPQNKEQQMFDFYMITMLSNETLNIKINFYVDECRKILLTSLRKELLKDVFYSIKHEIKNVQNKVYHIDKIPFESFLNTKQLSFIENLKNGIVEEKIFTKRKFIKTCKLLFEHDEIRWKHEYGGKTWGNICKAWLNLYESSSYNDIIIWIDHIYDLEHNTGTIFNKLSSYYKEGEHWTWIKQALNIKKNINSPIELIDKVSPKMKTLAYPAIHAKKYP